MPLPPTVAEPTGVEYPRLTGLRALLQRQSNVHARPAKCRRS